MTIDTKANIPLDDPEFQGFIKAFVFNCPSATVISKKKAKVKTWVNVSARDCSFRTREITGTLLSTMTAQIKRLLKNQLYQMAEKDKNVDAIFDASKCNEKIVFKENSQMSDAEAVFYYIRNAFAHGSFEVVVDGVEKYYKLESSKKGVIKAQMILKESTLKKLADLSAYNKKQIEALQKKKKR